MSESHNSHINEKKHSHIESDNISDIVAQKTSKMIEYNRHVDTTETTMLIDKQYTTTIDNNYKKGKSIQDVHIEEYIGSSRDYDIEMNPVLKLFEKKVENIADVYDVNRPKTFFEELVVMSYAFYVWCTPKEKTYPIIFTPVAIAINWMIFLMTLLTVGQTKCQQPLQYDICSEAFIYLTWGGSTGLLNDKEVWRLLTAGFHHANFIHVASNTVMMCVAGWWIESKYGSKRLWIIYLTSIVGGNILSWIAYESSSLVIGASGGAYGLIFLIFGDCAVNWETVRWRWTTVLCFGTGMIFCMLIEAFFAVGIAVFSHLGGGLSSLWVSVLILPNFKYRSWEKYLTLVALLCFLIQFIALPLIAAKIR
jgi:membrane associated rhomboid family serine protease